MTPPMRGGVVTPTYNERENLEEFVTSVRRQELGLHVLVVDDNSPDGTGRLADELSAKAPQEVSVLHRASKQGLAKAYVAGFRHALSAGYEVIVQMDADLSHDAVYLHSILAKLDECDLVLGSRYIEGINVVNWDFKRLVLSKLAARYVQLVTGMGFTDATSGYKCWRAEALRSMDLGGVFSSGYLFQVEMTYKALKKGFRIAEVPIIFYERNLGRSKIDLGIIIEAIWGVIRLRLRP